MENWFTGLFVKIGVFVEACYGIVISAMFILNTCNVLAGNESIFKETKDVWIVTIGLIMLVLCATFIITNSLDEDCFLAQTTYWISFIVGTLFVILAFFAIMRALTMRRPK